MKPIKFTIFAATAALLTVGAVSCKNSDNDFPDYEGGVSAFFANQYPTRTIVLGDWDQGDNTLDNQHKFQILATQGGAYESQNLKINVAVDETLVDGLTFPDGSPVKVMPGNYYKLATTTFTKKYPYFFGSDVELTDAFFADPDAIKNTYVIPLVMVNAIGADRILTGTPAAEGATPVRTDASAWSVLPQDYVLYCVKYVNPWDASYVRTGKDEITDAAAGNSTVNRQPEYIEKGEVVRLTTKSMTEVIFPLSTIVDTADGSKETLTCDLVLKFDGDNCTVSTQTPGMTASGSGKFVKKGAKHSINNEDRDVINLEYTVDFGPRQFKTTDQLIVRSREIVAEKDFKPVYTK